jgi:hypothetical protein
MRPVLAALLASAALAASAPAAHAFTVVNNGLIAYRIDGVDNPTLNLVRGQTYTFNVNAVGHPFWIKTAQIIGTGSAYNNGVTGNGTQSGTVTWVVPSNAPAVLYYNCQNHDAMTGEFDITGGAAVPGLTPLTTGALLALLAGAGWIYTRRRRRA